MPIKIVCVCGKKLSVKDEHAGKTLKCPECQKPLRVPKPKVEAELAEDEWDLGDSAEEDFDDEPAEAPAKSRGGKSSASRGAVSRKSSAKGKGKKSKSSNRGLLIGLSAGGGVLVVALLTWLLWPAAPAANVAGNPPVNQEPTSAPASGDTAKPTNSAPQVVDANDVGGDLKALQGVWQMSDLEVPNPLSAANEADTIKAMQCSFQGETLTLTVSNQKSTSSVKLDPSQNPKAIDLTSLDGTEKGKTQFGIYAIDGDTLKWCFTSVAGGRPKEFKPDKATNQHVMVFKRGSSVATVPSAPTNAVRPGALFDHKAWGRVQPTLAQLGLQGQLLTRREAPESIPDGLQAVAVLVLPDLSASDRYPDNTIVTIKSLSHVIVKTVEINDAKLKQLSEHPGLIGLNLSGKSIISADGLRTLKQCPLFRHLHLEQVRLALADLMTVIGEFSNLSSLSLNDMSVTDDLLSNFLPLKGLDTLSLQNTSVTDAGTAQLAKLSSLKTLFLDGSKITDQGLPSLKSLNKLTLLSVRRLNVSPQAVDDLQKALPNCKILK